MLTDCDIAWAAGFLEGEGCFALSRTTCTVTAAQVQREPLERLQKMFGGSIYSCSARPGRQPYFTWTLYGPNAAGLMMTLWTLMSPRRRGQIEKALAVWRDAPLTAAARVALKNECKRGHNLAEHAFKNNLGHRVCRLCLAVGQRKYVEKRREAREAAHKLGAVQ